MIAAVEHKIVANQRIAEVHYQIVCEYYSHQNISKIKIILEMSIKLISLKTNAGNKY